MEFLHFDHAVMPTLANNAALESYLVQMLHVQFAEEKLTTMIRFMFNNEDCRICNSNFLIVPYSEAE